MTGAARMGPTPPGVKYGSGNTAARVYYVYDSAKEAPCVGTT
jgi:hypothetical protein